MRRSKKVLLSTLSFLALMTVASASYAGSAKDFGRLKPTGHWKVGLVDGEAAPYCAMVNQFDNDAVLAFSRNGDGEGSVAIDFHKEFFNPGMEYEITMQVDDEKARYFTSRATSDKSVVVQLGQDKKFNAALNEEGALKVRMDAVTAKFVLREFADGFVNLLDCAGTLHAGPKTAAVPVPDVDTQPLSLSENSQKEGSTLKLKTKADADVRQALEDQIEQQKQKLAALEKKQSEQQQTQDTLKQAVEQKDGEISKLQTSQKEQDKARSAEMDKQEQALAQKVSDLQKERDALRGQMGTIKKSAEDSQTAATQNEAVQNSLKAKEAELAAALKEQTKKSAEITQLLATSQTEYRTKLAAAETERQQIQKRLDEVTAENSPLKASVEKAVREMTESKARIAALESSLSSATEQKKVLSERVEAQSVQAKQLQEALSAKDQELMKTKVELSGGTQRLADVQAELKTVVVEKASVIDRLQTELKEREAQYNTVKSQVDTQTAALPMTFKMAAELAQKKSEVVRLQKQLSEIELEREANAQHVQKAQQQLSALSSTQAQKLESVRIERDALQKRLQDVESTLAAQKLAFSKQAQTRGVQIAQSAQRKPDVQVIAAPLFGTPVKPVVIKSGDEQLQKDLVEDDILSDAEGLSDITPYAGGDDNAPVPLSADGTPGSAKAFLDKIMTYHRPVGAADKPSAVPVTRPAGPSVTAEPIAPLPPQAAVVSPAAAMPERITLEGLLNSSGVAINNFVPVDQSEDRVLSRWTSGKISGMYEEESAGDFESQAAAYIDRYRQDCGDDLDVKVSAPETSGVGTTATADIECKMPSNSYVTSFLFLQDDNGFNVLLHTSYPSEKGAVHTVRDAMLKSLKNSAGFTAPQMMSKRVQPARYRLNVPDATEMPVADGDDTETVVIE